jgi:hypothetical protein
MSNINAEIERLLGGIPIDFGGGCSLEKACLMAYLIQRFKMATTLDIGVYRGRSLFPQALAHRSFTGGVAYGVDPWSSEEAVENDNVALKEKIDCFVRETDYDAVYASVESVRRTAELDKHCRLTRKTSADAADDFRREGLRFDLIHIDGNHDTAIVLKDVELYVPLLAERGFLVMDDISWESVRPAYELVAARMAHVYERVDAFNDYAVFWNRSSFAERLLLRSTLKRIGRSAQR